MRCVRLTYPPSLPGLTRQSIFLSEALFFSMDARVKPGHDESRATAVGTGPLRPYGMLPSSRHPDVSARCEHGWIGASMNRVALLLAATVLFTAGRAAAQSVSEFYAGRQITFLVGASTGGGYDHRRAAHAGRGQSRGDQLHLQCRGQGRLRHRPRDAEHVAD